MPFETPRARRVLTLPQWPAPRTRYWDSSASDEDILRPPVRRRPTHLIISGSEREVPSDWSANLDEHNYLRVRDRITGRYTIPIPATSEGNEQRYIVPGPN